MLIWVMIALARAAGKRVLVDPKGEVVETARNVGISFGDTEG